MITIADKIIEFNKSVDYQGKLPDGIRIMNPFRENGEALDVSSAFYRKFYSDRKHRYLILGINPGRFGAGVTGIPFTDTKRLRSVCGLDYHGQETHEPSSVFVYDVINAYGGPERFYQDIYINSVCPLGFTITNANGSEKNYNYYDSRELTIMVEDFIIDSLRKQLGIGINPELCFCFGKGKNENYLRRLNEKHCFVREIIALEHPRFIMQYRAREKQRYIDKYLEAFERIK